MHFDGVIFISNIGSIALCLTLMIAITIVFWYLSYCSHMKVKHRAKKMFLELINGLKEMILSNMLDLCILCIISFYYFKLDTTF